MYNQTYEDYIRSILGYPNQMDNTYSTNTRENVYMQSMSDVNSDEIEQFYPEIYKIVYPMVCKVCNNNTRPITKELIESMTNDIYFSIESDNEIGLNITLVNNVRTSDNSSNANSLNSSNSPNTSNNSNNTNNFNNSNRFSNSNNFANSVNLSQQNTTGKVNQSSTRRSSESQDKVENREDTAIRNDNRRIRNNSLRDLIQILIIRQLLRNRHNRPNRPNPPPPRPPFPGGPGQGPGQGRPPIMPRSSFYNETYPMRFQDIYETF